MSDNHQTRIVAELFPEDDSRWKAEFRSIAEELEPIYFPEGKKVSGWQGFFLRRKLRLHAERIYFNRLR